MSDRYFGVEIECGHPRGWQYVRSVLHDEGFRYTVGQDGSGVEVRTPKLSGEKGLQELRAVMALLVENGAYVARVDGLHVHHDGPEFRDNRANQVKLIRSWFDSQRLITKFVNGDRRRAGGPCPLWTRDAISRLEQATTRAYDGRTRQFVEAPNRYLGGRWSLNLTSLRPHGSIEIRLHEGTLDADKAVAWVLFGQRFIEGVLARKQPLKCPDSEELLLKRLRLPKKAQEKLLAAVAA